MRQAVFSSIASRVPGSRFLDLFAGSGSYGLEAVSRGAADGVFVEKSPDAVDCIRANMAAVCKSMKRGMQGLEVFTRDATTVSIQLGPPPDLVFVDPPYEVIAEVAPRLFQTLTPWLEKNRDPVVIFEMPGDQELTPPGWTCVKRLGKGSRQPTACFFRLTREVTGSAPAPQ